MLILVHQQADNLFEHRRRERTDSAACGLNRALTYLCFLGNNPKSQAMVGDSGAEFSTEDIINF